jgi:hypothetical protein
VPGIVFINYFVNDLMIAAASPWEQWQSGMILM